MWKKKQPKKSDNFVEKRHHTNIFQEGFISCSFWFWLLGLSLASKKASPKNSPDKMGKTRPQLHKRKSKRPRLNNG
jgi:hypothetical protein